MNFFVRPIIRPPANLYKNDGGGGGGGGPKFVYPEMATNLDVANILAISWYTIFGPIPPTSPPAMVAKNLYV